MRVFLKSKAGMLLLIIFVVASLLRLYRLSEVPFGLTHDELGYIYNAFAISQTGANVFGEKLPLFTWMVKGGFPFLPVPIYLSAPFFFFLPLTAFTGRLPAALLGIADVFLLFMIIKKLFKSDALALLSCFFLAISPWHLHFSRSAYDPNFALFFYMLAIVSFLIEIEKKRLPIISSIAFLFAIFTYRGMNAVFFPLALLLILYALSARQISRKMLAMHILGIGIVIASFMLVILSFGSSYTQEALFFNDPKIQEAVDKEIREAQGPLWIRRLFLNKPSYIAAKLRDNYLGSYSPEFLFLHTEPHKIYSIWSRGRIYFIDLLFIIIGIFYLFRLNKRAAVFVFSCILIGGIPGLLGGMPYSARNFFIAGFLPVLSAGGVIGVLNALKRINLRYLMAFVIVVLYSYSFGSYLFDYYGRYAYQSAESWAKSLKDLSFLIQSEEASYARVIVGNTSFGDVVQYAFYNKVPVQAVQASWQKKTLSSEGREVFHLNNITFQPSCEKIQQKDLPSNEEKGKILLLMHDDCDKKLHPIKKIQDYYGNTVWKIYSIKSL